MFGVPITLTTQNTPYNLYTLAHAVDASIPQNAHQVIIQPSVANTGGGNLFLGGPNLTNTNYGDEIGVGDSTNITAEFNGVALDGIYLLSDTAAYIVNVLPQVI